MSLAFFSAHFGAVWPNHDLSSGPIKVLPPL
jgi:hypothetical protein